MRANPRVLFAAGLMAGAAVGALDGVRVSVLAHLDLGGLLACVVLTAAIDALAGAALGAVAALLLAVGRWGRAVRPGRLARVLGWVVTGGLVALVAAGAVMATALRMNRFLAAGVVCVAALVAGFAGAVAAPAVSRILGRSEPAPSPLSAAGVWLAAPLTGLALAVAMFVPLWRVRPPLRADARLQLTIVAAALAALLPAALDLGSRLFPSLPRRWARLAAALGFGLPAVAVVWIRWIRDFQFLRWNDVIVLGAIAVGALVLRRGKVLVGVAGVAAAAALVLIAGVSEPARKAASARAGLAAPVLDAARVALDFDHDGFPSLLGGGDCNDHDPEVHPGAQEWPDDGVDQNCDGKDASAAALRAPPLASVPESVPADLNLVLVTVDTLRADHLGCYGYGRPTSPEIDRFAQGAVLFENGWAHAPSTRYSMPAIATGRWPTAIDWDYSVWWPRIGRADATLGEAMKASGYTTGALYAFHYFNRAEARGFERGIDDYQDQRASLHEDINGNPAESKGTSAREIADDAIAFFNRNKDHKFFLWVHFYDPHFDYAPHPGGRSFGPRQIDLYDGEIWFTDEQMGRVLAELDRLELTGKTAVLLTGDHGEGFGEHGITTHGYHLYAPQTRVPFILKVPGLAPRRVTTPVGHVDIAPTFVNLARGKPQPTFLGRSMVDLAAGAPLASPPRPVLQDFDFELGADMHGTRRSGLVTESHHLLWNATPDNTTECYDRRSNPGEVRDLWGSAAGAPCRAMKSELQDLISVLSLPADFAEKLAAGVSAPGRPAPAPVHPVDARLGTAIRFEGYDLDPPVVSRGGEVQVVYHYEVLAPVPKGYRPFVHLDGPGGVRILDHVPVEGTLPAERWRPGQHIRDRQRIAFPATLPPGRYTLYTGFFHRTDRLPVSPASAGDGANRLRVAVIDLR